MVFIIWKGTLSAITYDCVYRNSGLKGFNVNSNEQFAVIVWCDVYSYSPGCQVDKELHGNGMEAIIQTLEKDVNAADARVDDWAQKIIQVAENIIGTDKEVGKRVSYGRGGFNHRSSSLEWLLEISFLIWSIAVVIPPQCMKCSELDFNTIVLLSVIFDKVSRK